MSESSTPDGRPSVVLLTGGLGGARLAPALAAALGAGRLTVIANSGDDLTWRGLRVCPDLDSVLYALAGRWDAGRGWGVLNESWQVRDTLAGLGAVSWFNVGDRDLALHLLRAEHLHGGATLSAAAGELAAGLGITGVRVLPGSDETAETWIETDDGRLMHFQEWYVREGARPGVRRARLTAAPLAPDARAALEGAGAVILGPSNPVSSIGALLALEGMTDAVRRVPVRVAVSPVVCGIASENPGIHHHALARQQLLAAEGVEDTPAAIATRYRSIATWFLLDDVDAGHARQVCEAGLQPVCSSLLDSTALAQRLTHLIDRAACASGRAEER